MRVVPLRRFRLSVLLLIAMCAVPVARAQVDPLWDHYKVYREFPALTIFRPLTLTDQFETTRPDQFLLEWFMNPAAKTVLATGQQFPIHNEELHYTWWRIQNPDPFEARVVADNQFGTQSFQVTDGVYLLNPALKNPPIPSPLPPRANHYKCYSCQGQPVNQLVQLTDQFGAWQATVTFPRYFCNPVQKTEATRDYPILDTRQHYVCYEFQPSDPRVIHGVNFNDQFVIPNGIVQVDLGPSSYMCVPTIKTGVVPTKSDTWGRLKMMYR